MWEGITRSNGSADGASVWWAPCDTRAVWGSSVQWSGLVEEER